jgi:hypothetical protein
MLETHPTLPFSNDKIKSELHNMGIKIISNLQTLIDTVGCAFTSEENLQSHARAREVLMWKFYIKSCQ